MKHPNNWSIRKLWCYKSVKSFLWSNFKKHAILAKAFSFWLAFLHRDLTRDSNANLLSIWIPRAFSHLLLEMAISPMLIWISCAETPVIAPVPFLTLYSLYTKVKLTLILINVQYLQNAVFSFEKDSNGQNHSSSNAHHPTKKSFPSKIYHFLHPLTIFRKPCFLWPSTSLLSASNKYHKKDLKRCGFKLQNSVKHSQIKGPLRHLWGIKVHYDHSFFEDYNSLPIFLHPYLANHPFFSHFQLPY